MLSGDEFYGDEVTSGLIPEDTFEDTFGDALAESLAGFEMEDADPNPYEGTYSEE